MKCSPALPFSVSPWHLTRRSLTPGWLAMALLLQFFFMSPALADTAALNRNRGVWDLNGDYSAFWACHPLLGDVGFTAQTTVSTTQPYWRSQNIGTVFAPRTVQLLECPLGFTDTQRLVVLQWAGPNGPPAANGTHNWTLVMDVRFNMVGGWIGLLQTTATTLDGTGVEDGEIFVNPSGALDFVGAGVVGSANGAIAANIWYRLAFRASYNAVTGLQELRAFINGVPAGNTVTTAPNGRFSLSSRIPLFTDNDGETAPLGINSLGFWGEALSDSDLLDIGAFRSTGISWTGLTPTCTLPTLTGKLYFGDFLTTFNPATSPAEGIGAATQTGSTGSTVLNLATNLGKIPGMANHTFGGRLPVDVLANGDCLFSAGPNPVPVNFNPPVAGAADIDSALNIKYLRSGILLRHSGAIASALVASFPPGFSVAARDKTRRNNNGAVVANVPLKALLMPKNPVIFTQQALTLVAGDTGNIFPTLDRVPVKWTTPSVEWNATTGKFIFFCNVPLSYHRADEFAKLDALGSTRGSNDLIYLWARSSSVNVVISARADGVAAIDQMQFTLDPTKFGGTQAAFVAHYPYRMVLGWTGVANSVFSIQNDLVHSTSKVTAPTNAVLPWFQSCLGSDCAGPNDVPGTPLSSTATLTPSVATGWRFTPDGGMQADVTTNLTSVPFGAFVDANGTQYAHILTSGPAMSGRVLMGGTAVKGTEVAALPAGQRPAALLMSGYSSPTNAGRLERPGTAGYLQGEADYPGLNLRQTSGGPTAAVSRLAGSPTNSYALRNTSKYYLGAGGVSGKHDSVNGPGTTFTAGGVTYTISALRLGFIDSQNVSSGVTGGLQVVYPADFSLTFSGLRFGCRGELEGATLTGGQPEKILKYWNTRFTPLAMGFGQPKVCPPDPSKSFLMVTMKADFPALATTGAVATMGFIDGDILTESLQLSGTTPAGSGIPHLSRFALPGTLLIPGPQTETWPLQPTTGIYLTRYGNGTASPDANVAGLLDVPFFEDTRVLVSASASSTANVTAPLNIRNQWEKVTDTGDFEDPTDKVFDPTHRGRPPDVALTAYHTGAAYDVALYKKWLDVVDLEFKVKQDSSRRFSSGVIERKELVIFKLRRQVIQMTPKSTELAFDGQALFDFQSQLNVGTLLGNTGLLSGLPSSLPLGPALTKISGLEQILGDTLEPVLRPGLTTIANTRAPALHSGLLLNSSPAIQAVLTNLTSDLGSLFDAGSTGIPGAWRNAIQSKIALGKGAVQDLKSLMATAGNLATLANAVRSTVSPGSAPLPEGELPALSSAVESSRLSLLALLNELEAQFTTLEGTLAAGGTLSTALRSALGNTAQLTALINQAANDVAAKWEGHAGDPNYFNDHPATELAADLATALTNRLLASTFATSAATVLRQAAGDPQTLLRQAMDDILRQAGQVTTAYLDNNAVAAATSEFIPSFGSARIQGYARINGDSLNELRLDGQLRLKLPDDGNTMKFDGHCLIRSLDSTTPDAACLIAGGAKTEVSLGASSEMNFGGRKSSLNLGGKFTLGDSGSVVGIAGDIGLGGEFDFEAIKLTELKFGFGAGADNAYVYGRAAGSLEAMSVAAGIFIGKTCDISVIKNADADIGTLLADPSVGLQNSLPLTGAVAYAEGSMSLMPIIGIPPSCLLDLRIGGGQGFFAFLKPDGFVAGIKQSVSVSGELLCLVNVGGNLNYVMAGNATLVGGRLTDFSLAGSATATVTGEIGYSPFSYDFEKSIRLNITAAPVKWSLDY